MGWSIISTIIGLLILYFIIYSAVKDGIDRSEVGQLLIKKFGDRKEIPPVTDDEIEKELVDEFKKYNEE